MYSCETRFLTGFEKSVVTYWKELQIEENFCDVTLACEDKLIKVHKVVISFFSPILKNILVA